MKKSQIAVEYIILTAFSLFLISIGLAVFLIQSPKLKSNFCEANVDMFATQFEEIIKDMYTAQPHSKKTFQSKGLACIKNIHLVSLINESYIFLNTSYFQKIIPINHSTQCDISNCNLASNLIPECSDSETCNTFSIPEFSTNLRISVQKSNSTHINISIQ